VGHAAQTPLDRALRLTRRGGDDGVSPGRIADLADRDRRGSSGEAMTTKADQVVDRGADKLEELAERTAAEGGVKAKLSDELADDAAFLRKLKPSLMVKRAKGEAPTNEKPGEPRRAPAAPQLGGRPKPVGKRKGPSPWVVLGGAIVGGYFLAKVVDWRGHAHPRD
jgi:hypothetical protein